MLENIAQRKDIYSITVENSTTNRIPCTQEHQENSVLGCRSVFTRLISIRLKAAPFIITIVQVYAPTTDYDDDQVKGFYDRLQEIIDKVDKKDIRTGRLAQTH